MATQQMNKHQHERGLAVGLLVTVIGFIIFVIILPLINQGLALHEEKIALTFRLQQY